MEAAHTRGEEQRAKEYRRILRDISRQQRIENIGDTVAWIGGLAVLGGIAVIGWQCYWWLRTATWPSMTLESGLHELGFYPEGAVQSMAWRGVANIFDWFLNEVPLSLLLLIGGIWIAGFGMFIREKAERR